MSESLRTAVNFILGYINSMAEFDFPGTNISMITVLVSPLVIILLWRFFVRLFMTGRGD